MSLGTGRDSSRRNDSAEPGRLHHLAEERSLAYHREVAHRLRTDPSLLETARRRVEEWLELGGRSAPYALRWREILGRSIDEITSVLVDAGEEARALRQSTPFAGAIDARERWRLWREVRDRLEGRG